MAIAKAVVAAALSYKAKSNNRNYKNNNNDSNIYNEKAIKMNIGSNSQQKN